MDWIRNATGAYTSHTQLFFFDRSAIFVENDVVNIFYGGSVENAFAIPGTLKAFSFLLKQTTLFWVGQVTMDHTASA